MSKPIVNWGRIDALTDEQIEKAIANDPDAAPLLDSDFFEEAELIEGIKSE